MLADGFVNKFNASTLSEEVCCFYVIRRLELFFILNNFDFLLYVGVGNMRWLARVSFAGRDSQVMVLYPWRDLWSNLIR